MLHLELSQYDPPPLWDYPPCRCTCTPWQQCVPCGGKPLVTTWQPPLYLKGKTCGVKTHEQRRAEIRARVARWLERYGRYPTSWDLDSRSYPQGTRPPGYFSNKLVRLAYPGFVELYVDCLLHGIGTPADYDAATREPSRRIAGSNRRRAWRKKATHTQRRPAYVSA